MAADVLLSDVSRVIFAPAQDEFGAPYDMFGFVANDGLSDSAPAVVTVIVLPRPLIQSAEFVAGGFQFGFEGVTNAIYSVQGSTNLTAWTRLGTASQSSPGQFLFLDPGTTNRPARFYRVTSP